MKKSTFHNISYFCKYHIGLFLVFIACSFFSLAQQIRPANSEKIYHEIAQLRHLVNVLYVAAHPDDENTRFLAWMVNEKNIRTGYLSLTRGDGGQNILGSEQGEALGLIRTHELMEARKLDGAEQYFTRAIDFGFSKSYQETFLHWSEDSLVEDAVWVMRKFRPDVVICRFPPTTQAGHGQHAASAIVAAKAFKACGDKNMYLGQLHYLQPCQPKRLYWNTFKFGDRNTTSEDQLKMQVGQYEPELGVGSGELAGMSRSIHKSQGAGTPSVAGVQTEYFKFTDGDSAINSIFDGIDVSWGRVERPDIGEDLKTIEENFRFLHPDESLPALIAVRNKIETVKDNYWRSQKLKEIDKVIMDCTGLMVEVYAKQPQTVAGSTVPFTLHLIARSQTPVMVKGIQWGINDTTTHLSLAFDSLYTIEHPITIPSDAPITEPYWLALPHHDKDLFTLPSDTLTGLPETLNNLNIILKIKVGDIYENLTVPLSYKKLDPLKGDVVEQMRIVPDATLSFSSSLLVSKPDGSIDAAVTIHANKELNMVTLETGYIDAAIKLDIDKLRENADTTITLHIPKEKIQYDEHGKSWIDARLRCNDKVYFKTSHLIQYSHLPTLQYCTPDAVDVIKPNWKCSAKHIGYIEGAGDKVPTVLREAGLEVTILKEADLKDAAKLQQYDAIMTGIRSVNVEKRMALWLPTLLKYVQNGGTLVMQYNTLQELSTTTLGPYPFTIGDKRVTEEDAIVNFTDPICRLLNYPNKITYPDFVDWVQERGLYFATKWDEHYQTPFSMNDKDEQPLLGSTLYTKYGKGNYIYTTLSFSRQLPAGNAGAIRLLMNMLSVGK